MNESTLHQLLTALERERVEVEYDIRRAQERIIALQFELIRIEDAVQDLETEGDD